MSQFKTIMSVFRAEMVKEIKEQESLRERAVAHTKIADVAHEMIGQTTPDEWMTNTIKRSKMQEKLYRYAHNLDIEKVEKYDRKLHELDMEQMEHCRENPEKYMVFQEETKETVRNEGAYLSLCDEAKWQFEDRAKLIKFLKMLIEVKSAIPH
tara:strand:+ start:1961 stop:2419 length:459 start_codon:yes stop_codon:yes gene_type:complete